MGCAAVVPNVNGTASITVHHRSPSSPAAQWRQSTAPPMPLPAVHGDTSVHVLGYCKQGELTAWYLVSRLWFEPRITVAAFHPTSGLVSWVRWCTSLEAALHSLPEFVESRRFPAILGYRVLGSSGYLLVGNRLKLTCNLPPTHRVYTLLETEWLVVPLKGRGTLGKAEAEGLEAMLEYALDGLHICCETYDLTLPWPNDANPHKVPVPNDFAFNQHLRQPFSDVPELERLCPVVLQGLAEQRPLGDERDAFLSYLVRKSVVNPGPRLHARGLNHNSGPANEYECELLLWYRAGQEYCWASYVWRRGSVPLCWQSVASGLSEELLLSDDIAHQAEWYFYGLMQRYSYLLRAPQPFVAPPTLVGDERKDSSCSTQTPSTPSAAFGNERSPPASPLPKAHSPDATSVLTRRFSTAPARDLMSRLQSTVENLLNPSTPLSGGSRSSSRFPTKRPCLPVSCISLLRLSGNPSEERLNAAFRDAAPGIAQRVEEVAEALDGLGELGYGGVGLDVRQLDWHEETKCRGALGAADALLGITNTKDVGFSVGSFQVSGNDTLLTASIHQLQGGLLRPNCRDSLDRTNLACFWLTINVLPAMSRAIQLDALILRPPPSSGDLPSPTAKMSRLPSFRPTLSSPKASPGPSPSPSPRSGCPSPQALPSPRGAL
eukprot:EG_transcript_5663